MQPAAGREPQPAMGHGDSRATTCLCGIDAVNEIGRQTAGQHLFAALGLAGVEGLLQETAVIPVAAFFQELFRQLQRIEETGKGDPA